MVSDITRLDEDGIDHVLVSITSMGRRELCEQLLHYPATFPIDFTEAFLNAQSTDKLRHILARLVLHCRIAPQLMTRAG